MMIKENPRRETLKMETFWLGFEQKCKETKLTEEEERKPENEWRRNPRKLSLSVLDTVEEEKALTFISK